MKKEERLAKTRPADEETTFIYEEEYLGNCILV